MSLRFRLSVAFIFIVVVPLAVAAIVVRGGLAKQAEKRVAEKLSAFSRGSDQVFDQYAERAAFAVSDLSVYPGLQQAVTSGKPADVQKVLDRYSPAHLKDRIDYIVVTDAKGKPLARVVHENPQFARGVAKPDVDAVARDAAIPVLEREELTLVDSTSIHQVGRMTTLDKQPKLLGAIVAGFWLDQEVLADLPNDRDVRFTFVADGNLVATTLETPEMAQPLVAFKGETETTGKSGDLIVESAPVLGTNRIKLLATYPNTIVKQTTNTGLPQIVLVFITFVVLAGLLGWLLARVTTRPLLELSEAALKVAGGRLDSRIEVRSRDEVGRLAVAFNTMTDELRTYINALQDSRDELKRNLTRLGDTLSSTHDLKKMLAVILETAMVTLRAEAGCLMLFSGNREELYLKVGRGLDGRVSSSNVRVKVGEGVAGKVASRGEAMHGVTGPDGDVQLAPSEPRADSVVSVPLKSQGRVIGVLNLYDRVDADEFDDNDVATIRSFANQATVAIDNVLLHQEAQRLSITDGLTGLWNYRYFQMQFEREIEGATRFHRPLSLLILDLDKFKSVNDEYGHQRGDSVLIELATRVKGAIRDVDIFARYGGEEFVLVLPETDLEGAQQTADKICDLVRQRRFGSADEAPIRLTVSIGISVFGDHGVTGAEMIKAADGALYIAKESGRDGWWTADPIEGGVVPPPHIQSIDPAEAEAMAKAARASDENDVDLAEMVSLVEGLTTVEPAEHAVDDAETSDNADDADDADGSDEPAPHDDGGSAPSATDPAASAAEAAAPEGGVTVAVAEGVRQPHAATLPSKSQSRQGRYPSRAAVRRTPTARAASPRRRNGR